MQKQYSHKPSLQPAIHWTIVALMTLILIGCGAQRKTTTTPAVVTKHYQTVSARQLPVTITADSMTYTVYCTMQARRDSVVVLSLQPLAGRPLAQPASKERRSILQSLATGRLQRAGRKRHDRIRRT